MPEKYLETAVIINDGTGDNEEKAKTKPVVNKAVETPTATVASTPGKAAGKELALFRSRMLKSLGIIPISIVIFFVISKRADMLKTRNSLL
ncbi:MAG TPA: hypothetical protein VEP29_10515 [Desulfatiglandales bacterium]|nr:hypothetical protein [Desulfatiglandales bacterium]